MGSEDIDVQRYEDVFGEDNIKEEVKKSKRKSNKKN